MVRFEEDANECLVFRLEPLVLSGHMRALLQTDGWLCAAALDDSRRRPPEARIRALRCVARTLAARWRPAAASSLDCCRWQRLPTAARASDRRLGSLAAFSPKTNAPRASNVSCAISHLQSPFTFARSNRVVSTLQPLDLPDRILVEQFVRRVAARAIGWRVSSISDLMFAADRRGFVSKRRRSTRRRLSTRVREALGEAA